MAGPGGVSDSRSAPVADRRGTGFPHRGERFGFEDLNWTDVADIVWLAAAISPRRADGEPAPADEMEHSPADVRIRNAPADRGEIPELPEPGPSRLVDGPPDAEDDGEVVAIEAVPGELPEPAVDGDGPGGAVLLESLEYFRALRTLKRETASRRHNNVVLDEVATAVRVAETGRWWPVTRSRKERWLDLTLVLDNGPSMALWRPRVSAFVELLRQVGAFRTIQVRLLETGKDTEEDLVLRGGTPGAPARDPDEIVDSSGRRVVLLLTDGVGDAWQKKDALYPMLARWGRKMPVSIVHLLPRWLWGRCGMSPHQARLSVPNPVAPNGRWKCDLADAWLEPGSEVPAHLVPVPVLELRPRSLGWWAGLMTGENDEAVEGTVVLATERISQSDFDDPSVTLSPAERVQRFRSVASPPALRLAQLLAAVPVRLDVAKLVGQRFVPEAGPEHLLELLLSGMMYAPALREGKSTWDTDGVFAFPEAVRELLLSGARRSETANVVRVAATHFGDRIRLIGHLRDAIADPNNTPDPDLTRESPADVELETALMRALSGPYLSRADRLRNAAASQVLQAHLSETKTESSMMPETAERPPASTPATQGRSSYLNEPEANEPTTRIVHPSASEPSRDFPARQPDDPPLVFGNVPPRNPNFTGRDELLDQLTKRLSSGTTAVLPSALHGLGGIGKTQMAAEYIYRHLQDYDLVWWIDAAHTTQIRAGLTELAGVLGLQGASETNVAVPAVIEALRTGRPFRRWLLVFDAAESPDTVLPFFPRNGPGEILITSRNSDWAGIARPLELAVFKREESVELLGRRGPEIDPADADELAEKLGDLPLAVEQAAAWRAVTGMPVQEYLRLFDESVEEILDTASAPDNEVSVAAAWNVSFEELKTRNPAAHQILHICAFFSPEPISRDLLTGVNRVSISPELDAALRDPIKLARAIRDINRYGLAKIDHGNNTLQLHRLVQLVLRNRVMARQVHARMQHGAHQLLAALDPNDPESSRHWSRYRELLPHAYAANVLDCDNDWPRQLYINLMRYLFEYGDHEEAARLGLEARKRFTETLGPTHPQTLEVSSRLGLYLWAVGRYDEAAELNQRTLALRMQMSSEENEETFALQRNITIDLRAQGDFAGATKLSEEIFHKAKRMFGDDDPETLYAAFQHGISLRLAGAYREALELDQDTLRRRIEVLGRDHVRTFSVNSSRNVDLREAGEYGQARIQQERLTESFIARFGPDQLDSAGNSLLLAMARRKDGDHPGALGLSTEVLKRFRLAYGDDHGTTMASALAHSIDLRHSGDLAAARKLGEETFERYRRGLGEHHPHTLVANVNLAVTLRLMGDPAAARVLDERALEQFRATIGPDHPYAIIAAINLASDLAAVGELDRTVELGRDAIERGTQVLGEDHPTVLAASFNLGLDLAALGRTEEAAPFRDPILARYRRILGEAHPGTQAAGRGIRANCDIDQVLM
ncbi:FxSxx-COOH system tetratricopeptide repeat protein [Amycolatopsis sp. EV170708-02-1]|uniref:FxSxx-COOH system tetratricopeptide repeat protein n=1 Tax=Amycolatopsis sp. EV170708-02-1 TaxID=2919322 RepID=UPI001F0BEAA0|nr:FxSxx-COOH system tetratricopeptide repeat protein [Amycolatopsis sp. EV170708-02-1]UMP01446.1 FxSxx-COOH system tetratricopeptide repeat protein [Amycolatopsis sp. EV170708-02-1]